MRSEKVTAPSSFVANIGQLLEKLEYRPIETEADLDAVLRLRYAAYLKEGALTTNESQRLGDRFDALDNAVNIGVFHEDRLVAATRFHFLSKPEDDSPSMEVFSDFSGRISKPASAWSIRTALWSIMRRRESGLILPMRPCVCR